jgi:transketolase C-terminal domain/subunit
MRIAYGEALVELCRRREDVVVLSADVSNSDYSFLFRKPFPSASSTWALPSRD